MRPTRSMPRTLRAAPKPRPSPSTRRARPTRPRWCAASRTPSWTRAAPCSPAWPPCPPSRSSRACSSITCRSTWIASATPWGTEPGSSPSPPGDAVATSAGRPLLRPKLRARRQPLAGELRLGFGFGQRLDAGQAALEVVPDHLVHVEKEVDGLRHEGRAPGHAPRHHGLLSLRLEGELGRADAGERLEEFQLDPDEVARPTFHDRHAPLANLMVARPSVDGARSGRGSPVALLHGRIDPGPGRPRRPLVEIVDLSEDHRRWRRHAGRPRDAELGWLHGDDDRQDHRYHHQRHEHLGDERPPASPPLRDHECAETVMYRGRLRARWSPSRSRLWLQPASMPARWRVASGGTRRMRPLTV